MTPEIIESIENFENNKDTESNIRILKSTLFNNELVVVTVEPDKTVRVLSGFRINPNIIGQTIQVPEEELVQLEVAKMLLSLTQGSVNRFLENIEKDFDGSEFRETSTSESNREQDTTA